MVRWLQPQPADTNIYQSVNNFKFPAAFFKYFQADSWRCEEEEEEVEREESQSEY